MDDSEQAKIEWWKKCIMFTTPQMHSRIQDNHRPIQIANAKNQSAHSARNFGIILDENMSMAEQIKKICQSAYFQIRNINSYFNSITGKFCLMTLPQNSFML